MKCEDCGRVCRHYKSTSRPVKEYDVNVHQTKLYFACDKCDLVYVEIWPPVPVNLNDKIMVDNIDDYPIIKKYSIEKKITTLDKWIKGVK